MPNGHVKHDDVDSDYIVQWYIKVLDHILVYGDLRLNGDRKDFLRVNTIHNFFLNSTIGRKIRLFY